MKLHGVQITLTLFLVLIIVGGVLSFCFTGKRIQTFQDSKVTAGEISRPIDNLAVHLSKPKYITIDGKTYEGVRGLPPYYLEVPELNAILFVTEQRSHNVVFHLLNLETKHEMQIHAGSSGFGRSIGSGGRAGDPGTDYIEGVLSNRITVAMRSLDWKESMVLNLTTKSIDRRETLDFDSTGRVTNRSVQTDFYPPNR